MSPCYNINSHVITQLVPIVKRVFEKYKDCDFVSPYGFYVNIDEIDFPELKLLREKYPNNDNLLRFQVREKDHVGIHIDKNVPPCVVFPVRGCNEETETVWYDLIEGDAMEDDYNIALIGDYKVKPIHTHAITEPCILDPSVWHGVPSCKNRVIARWWT